MRTTAVAALAAGLLVAVAVPVAASGAPIGEITLTESIVFPGNAPPHGTFAATGLPGCASGTFVDDLKSFNASFTHILVERTYTCAGGAAGFGALLVLAIAPTGPTSETVSGRWIVQRASGALEGLRGSGTTTGENAAGAGTGTVEALVHLG